MEVPAHVSQIRYLGSILSCARIGAAALSALREWLRQNQLERYADTFDANDVDFDILPRLTDQDLADLGLSLGHRRRLKTALAERGTALLSAPARPGPQTEPERRQVTVLFCDLAGSTALATRTDPEILSGVMRRYQEAAAGAIGRFGGFVAKFMGDGVLAYFGFPRAFEDSAERAVRAALAIVREVGRIEAPDRSQLRTRIGIATGVVVVGEIVGTGSAQERIIVGETPNLAARLQALAVPDTTLVSEATHQLLGGLFEFEVSGPHEIRGFAAPVTAWRVIDEASVESRFAAIRRADLPLIGRAHEMGLLRERWGLARTGEGQIVTIIGDAGIGKSRIVEALPQEAGGATPTRVHLQCSPYHSDSALYPVIQQVARAAGFAANDPDAAKLAKLAALFPGDKIALAAELMSLPAAPSPLTPAQRKAATIAMINDATLRLSENAPVLVVVEDAHWIDATTLELVTQLADGIGSARVLALVTGRPEFVPPWQARPHATLLTVGRLGRAECAEMVATVAASYGLSAGTIAAIVAKTDGVPLFVEELTKAVMEATGDGVAVPATLKDSLMARLDRLGDARETAQIAAVIGRRFPLTLLDAVVTRHEALAPALERLVAAGIVFPEGRGTERGFTFKHALVRDVAYESLLLARRREWHERIARALEQGFPQVAASEPELLAHHFDEAGLSAETCDYRMRAGVWAVSRSAHKDAIVHFAAGLKAADSLRDPAERQRRQLAFLIKLGAESTLAQGPHSDAVADAYGRAAEIGEAVGDVTATYMAKWGLWYHAASNGRIVLSREQASELIRYAERIGDDGFLLEARHCRFSSAFLGGDVPRMLGDGRIGAESYDIGRHRHLGPAFAGHDPGVCAHIVMSVGLELSDASQQADAFAARSLALAETLDHSVSIVHALATTSYAHQFRGDRALVLATMRRWAPMAEKLGLYFYASPVPLITAWVDAGGADVAGAARLVDKEIDAAVRGNQPRYCLGLAGEVLLAAGRPGDGLAHLDRAIAMTEEPGVGLYLPEIYRLRGECLLALDRANWQEAQRAFATAREIAIHQGATLFERRAELALAELGGSLILE